MSERLTKAELALLTAEERKLWAIWQRTTPGPYGRDKERVESLSGTGTAYYLYGDKSKYKTVLILQSDGRYNPRADDDVTFHHRSHESMPSLFRTIAALRSLIIAEAASCCSECAERARAMVLSPEALAAAVAQAQHDRPAGVWTVADLGKQE